MITIIIVTTDIAPATAIAIASTTAMIRATGAIVTVTAIVNKNNLGKLRSWLDHHELGEFLGWSFSR